MSARIRYKFDHHFVFGYAYRISSCILVLILVIVFSCSAVAGSEILIFLQQMFSFFATEFCFCVFVFIFHVKSETSLVPTLVLAFVDGVGTIRFDADHNNSLCTHIRHAIARMNLQAQQIKF